MRFFWGVFIFLILQRLSELWLARLHTVRALSQGGYEAGREHYPWIVATHTIFFLGILIEVLLFHRTPGAWMPLWFALFVLAQIGRYWVIVSLGPYWNTRIIVIPGMPRIRRGPYRYLRHPNYVVVAVELLVIPLMFNAYITAGVVSLLNAVVLRTRIRVEEQALRQAAS